jgi:molybdopterin-guanine dinucleotide biosynthesis protein A
VVSGVILAGGLGSRIGGDKAGRLLAGRPLVQWVVDALQQVCDDIVVTVAPDQEPPVIRSRVPAIACVDLLPARGPLSGIYTGLASSPSGVVLTAPCDAPFIEPALLELLLAQRNGWDAVIPQAGGKLQTVIGVYARSCMPALIDALNGDDHSVTAFLSRIQARIVTEAEVRRVDPGLRSLFNVNRIADLCRAESMVAVLAAG